MNYGVQSSILVTPMWPCHAWHVACCTLFSMSVQNASSLASHLPNKLTRPTPQQRILLYTPMQHKSSTRWSYVEKPAETQTIASSSLAIWSECLTPNMKDMSSNPMCGHKPSTRTTQKTYNPVFYCIIPTFCNLRRGLQIRSREHGEATRLRKRPKLSTSG